MAISVPTAITGISPLHYLRNQPLRSGDAAADLAYGLRGISSEINHAYAYRVHQLESYSTPVSDTTEIWTTTTSGSWVELPSGSSGVYGVHHLCADVAYVAALADMEQGIIQLDVNGTTGDGSGVTTRATDTATVTVDGGDIGDIVPYRVKWKAQSGETCKIYRLCIYEVVLVAADFPT